MLDAKIQCFLVTPTRAGWCLYNGEHVSMGDLPAGAMWFADWYRRKGPDGHHLLVKTPGGIWHIDGRANNCTLPNDTEHHCWVRHGIPPDITVDKNGHTCGCGASIGQGENYRDYHGLLQNGVLIKV